MPLPLTPWGFDGSYKRDASGYLVVRGVDHRPIAYVERSFPPPVDSEIALLLARSPELLQVLKEGAFANTASWGKPEWFMWQQRAKLALEGLLK